MRGRRGALIGEVTGVGEKTGCKTLDTLVSERAAAADAVTNAIVERADAVAEEIFLAGVDSERIVGHFTEIETFAVQIHLAAVHAVLFEGELGERVLNLLHVGNKEEAHQIEPETVNLVLLGV